MMAPESTTGSTTTVSRFVLVRQGVYDYHSHIGIHETRYTMQDELIQEYSSAGVGNEFIHRVRKHV